MLMKTYLFVYFLTYFCPVYQNLKAEVDITTFCSGTNQDPGRLGSLVSLEMAVESDLPLFSAVLSSEAAAWARLLSTSLDTVCTLFPTKHDMKFQVPLPGEPGMGTGALGSQQSTESSPARMQLCEKSTQDTQWHWVLPSFSLSFVFPFS